MDNNLRNIQIYAGYILTLILTIVFWHHDNLDAVKWILTGASVIETIAIIYYEYIKWVDRRLYP